ncbi:hypothetical protein [Actinopolyspora mortivallis]|uniref:Uncharacterized protein n=1 Tax=Actinopolyspora mortivallis TaxID=33906 RepID=A0A2T0GTQ0_ACTMO|nr:hypothetical protein [Actinopolyspora mortivallis]PRW62495.1 hypothetical protein CEP50_15260 [Actinopolyspora mortivallis]
MDEASGTPEATVEFPAEACTPERLPGVCSRHGAPCTRRIDFALQSRVEVSGSRVLGGGNVLGLFGRFGERARRVAVVGVRGWPLCRRCRAMRLRWFGTAQVLFWGGLLAVLGGVLGRVVTGQTAAAFGVSLLGGFAAMLLAAVPFSLGGVPRVVRARAAGDGTRVLVDRPHPEFAARLSRWGGTDPR